MIMSNIQKAMRLKQSLKTTGLKTWWTMRLTNKSLLCLHKKDCIFTTSEIAKRLKCGAPIKAMRMNNTWIMRLSVNTDPDFRTNTNLKLNSTTRNNLTKLPVRLSSPISSTSKTRQRYRLSKSRRSTWVITRICRWGDRLEAQSIIAMEMGLNISSKLITTIVDYTTVDIIHRRITTCLVSFHRTVFENHRLPTSGTKKLARVSIAIGVS